MNGNVTQDGIQMDLEWMHRVGIGGIQNFDAALGTPELVDKRVIYMTPEWQDAFGFTARLADKLGLELSIAGSPGWSESGGPWVRPEQGMKKLVWSETRVDGGIPFAGQLPAPPSVVGPFQNIPIEYGGFFAPKPANAVSNFYRDVAVVAYRVPDAERTPQELHPTVTSSAGPINADLLADGDLVKAIAIPFGEHDRPAWIQWNYEQPQTMQSVTLALQGNSGLDFFLDKTKPAAELQSSDDGQSFHAVLSITATAESQQTLSFPAVTARYFRVLLFTPPPVVVPPEIQSLLGVTPKRADHLVAELVLHTAPRLDHFEEKAAYFVSSGLEAAAQPTVAPSQVIDPTAVVDLTAQVRQDGTLEWTPPPGRWVVLRMAYSLLGITNHPASPEGTGLEVDKLSRTDVKSHMDAYLGRYESFLGKRLMGAHGLRGMVNDSWEAGAQNWSETVPTQFAQRRGYDLRLWLPALTGQVIGSVEATERFLWDFRRTLGEILADDHYGQIAASLRERGMVHYGESHESGRAFIGDGMDVKRDNDVPMSAMWVGGFLSQQGSDADIRESASVAHLYGQNLVAAESMTSSGPAFAYAPEDLKPTADRELADGLNRFIIHTSVHQPLLNRAPGVTLGPFGQWFTRNETWAEQAGAWVSYLTRSSYLLQQGHFAADVLYFYGQDSNITALYAQHLPPVPEGYAFDFANLHALTLLSVSGHQLVTRTGMRYRVLALDPRTRFMSLDALRLIGALAAAGATVVGEKPETSPSLADNREEFRALATEIWGADAAGGEHPYGKGHVIRSRNLGDVLTRMGVAPDFGYTKLAADTTLWFVHRQLKDGDLYFVNNRNQRSEAVEASFRVVGKAPELWHADSGRRERAAYRIKDGRTIVPMKLDPSDAVFVVFRKPAATPELRLTEPARESLLTLTGPWTLEFQAGRGAPARADFDHLMSWTESADAGVKYFSGTATYHKTVTVPASWMSGRQHIELDLGTVRKLAQVSVNGKRFGTLWKTPYRVDVTRALHAGTNQLEIRITNLWVNRMIGDKQPGAKPLTFATFDPYKADSPLLESGLLGPVVLWRVAADRIDAFDVDEKDRALSARQ